jgi:hypothetical protein
LKNQLQQFQTTLDGLWQHVAVVSDLGDFLAQAPQLKEQLIKLSEEMVNLAESGKAIEHNYHTLVKLLRKVDNLFNSFLPRMESQPDLIQVNWEQWEIYIENLRKTRNSLGKSPPVLTAEAIESQKIEAQRVEQELLTLSEKVDGVRKTQNNLANLLQKLTELGSICSETTITSLQGEAFKYGPVDWAEYEVSPVYLNNAGELRYRHKQLFIELQPTQLILPEDLNSSQIAAQQLISNLRDFGKVQTKIKHAIQTMDQEKASALQILNERSKSLQELCKLGMEDNLGHRLNKLAATVTNLQQLLADNHNAITLSSKVGNVNMWKTEYQRLLNEIHQVLQAEKRWLDSDLANKEKELKVISTFLVIHKWSMAVQALLAEKEPIPNTSQSEFIIWLFKYNRRAVNLQKIDMNVARRLRDEYNACQQMYNYTTAALKGLDIVIKKACASTEFFPIDFSSYVKLESVRYTFGGYSEKLQKSQSEPDLGLALASICQLTPNLQYFVKGIEEKKDDITHRYQDLEKKFSQIIQCTGKAIVVINQATFVGDKRGFIGVLNELRKELSNKQNEFRYKAGSYEEGKDFVQNKWKVLNITLQRIATISGIDFTLVR